MNWPALVWIAVGGALGSVGRAVVSWYTPVTRLPWGTILVNVVGSLLIGWLMARPGLTGNWSLRGYAFAVVGFCGGFTTFSAFSWQTFEQMQKGQWLSAIGNVVLTITLCLVATWAGWKLAR